MTEVDDVKRTIPLLSVIRRSVEMVQRNNGDWWGCCPFHVERTPSFHVKEAEGYWHCFGCGKGGDIFDFVMHASKVGFASAVKMLAEESHITGYDQPANASTARASSSPPAPLRANTNWKQLLSGMQPFKDSPAEAYLHGRGIDLLAVNDMSLGIRYHPNWYGKGPAVIFQIADQHHQTVAAEGRYLNANIKPKVMTAGPKKAGLFITPFAFEDSVFIVEAPIDAQSLAICDIPAVATCGAENHPLWLPEACQGKKVWIAFDPDPGGDTGTAMLAADLARRGIQSKWLKPSINGMDWNDILLAYGRDALARALARVIVAGSDV